MWAGREQNMTYWLDCNSPVFQRAVEVPQLLWSLGRWTQCLPSTSKIWLQFFNYKGTYFIIFLDIVDESYHFKFVNVVVVVVVGGGLLAAAVISGLLQQKHFQICQRMHLYLVQLTWAPSLTCLWQIRVLVSGEYISLTVTRLLTYSTQLIHKCGHNCMK